jgi:hypothetical protein
MGPEIEKCERKPSAEPAVKQHTVSLSFQCGELTCASEPGKFCRFIGSKSFGTQPTCTLFNVKLFDPNGWVLRCRECLQLEETGKLVF